MVLSGLDAVFISYLLLENGSYGKIRTVISLAYYLISAVLR
jgi:hypothetical protein